MRLKYTLEDIDDLKPDTGGMHAVIYYLNKNWVLRNCSSGDGFRALAFLSPDERAKFGFPVIDDDLSNPAQGLFVVERLKPIPYQTDLFIHDWMQKLNNTNILCVTGRDDEAESQFKEFLTLYNPDDKLHCLMRNIIDAFILLQQRKQPVSIDLSFANIMQRKDGTYLVSDPFGHYSMCLSDLFSQPNYNL